MKRFRLKLEWAPVWAWVLMGMVCSGICLGLATPAWARIDPYINQYLQVSGPIDLPYDDSGHLLTVSPRQLQTGKTLFQNACINCHVGGITLPNPSVSLSLTDLTGAMPPRNTIKALMEYQRQPLSYDGSTDEVSCRTVSPQWMNEEDLTSLAAFLLRSAQVAPGWGTALMESR